MNIDNLTYGELKQIAAMFGGVQNAPESIDSPAITLGSDDYREVAQ